MADEQLTVPSDKGAHAGAKVTALVAGMVAGADSIEGMALLRHGGMARFTGLSAPSTLGSFLRTFAFGHVRQLDAVAARIVSDLAGRTPVLPDAERIAYLDVDDTIRATYRYAKQGAGYGYSGIKGLNALLAVLSSWRAVVDNRAPGPAARGDDVAAVERRVRPHHQQPVRPHTPGWS